jgi:hypothetical protein
MGYLLNAKWENGMGLEDLKTWGTDPLYRFLEMFDEYFVQGEGPEGGDHRYGVFIYYQMKNILMDMDTMIYRFWDDANERKKKGPREQDIVTSITAEEIAEFRESLLAV